LTEISVPEQAAEGAASLSGVQDKLALSHAKDGKRYCMPVKGKLSDLIAKLPAAGDDSQVMNEYACMTLASLAGVNVAPCRPAPMSTMTATQNWLPLWDLVHASWLWTDSTAAPTARYTWKTLASC